MFIDKQSLAQILQSSIRHCVPLSVSDQFVVKVKATTGATLSTTRSGSRFLLVLGPLSGSQSRLWDVSSWPRPSDGKHSTLRRHNGRLNRNSSLVLLHSGWHAPLIDTETYFYWNFKKQSGSYLNPKSVFFFYLCNVVLSQSPYL